MKKRRVLAATDFIKRPGLREQFWHGCPDLLIIDEAHTCVTDGTGGRSRMLRHELVNGLAKDPSRHLVLVTATRNGFLASPSSRRSALSPQTGQEKEPAPRLGGG